MSTHHETAAAPHASTSAPERTSPAGAHQDIVSVARLAPGDDGIVEVIAPAGRGPVAALALHEGLVVRCGARSSSGVLLQIVGRPDVIVPDELAEAILVRLDPAEGR